MIVRLRRVALDSVSVRMGMVRNLDGHCTSSVIMLQRRKHLSSDSANQNQHERVPCSSTRGPMPTAEDFAAEVISNVRSHRSLYNTTLPLLLKRNISSSKKTSRMISENSSNSNDQQHAKEENPDFEMDNMMKRSAQREGEDLAAEIRDTFRVTMEQRVGSNKTLQKYIAQLDAKEYDHASQAIQGSQEGGLQINAGTYEAYLGLLLRAGQLRLAMDTYQTMLQRRVTPSTKTYNTLIALVVDRHLPDAAITLVGEMRRRGRAPDLKTHELHLTALSQFTPARWEEAVQIFDCIQRRAHIHKKEDDARDPMGNAAHILADKIPTGGTYKALMLVYSKMEPFDWRVVYNAYYELRYHRPRIPFGPDVYAVVAEAMARGGAGYPRRFLTWFDAQLIMAQPGTRMFWWGVVVAMSISALIKILGVGAAKVFRRWYGIGAEETGPAHQGINDVFVNESQGGLGSAPILPPKKTAFQKWLG